MNQHNAERSAAAHQHLHGGGEMGKLMRSMDWSKTPLGPAEGWSPALRTMVRFLLDNRYQMLLWWGPGFCQLYNDAFLPCLGTKHPNSMGQPASECWHEIWHIIGPLIDTPFHGGETTWMDDLQLEMVRHGYLEETHWTVSYSPVTDASAPTGIGGVAATVQEITERIVGERRIVLLRDLGSRSSEAKTAEEACSIAAQTFSRHKKDVPFALLYLIDDHRKRARLAATAGLDADSIDTLAAVVDLTDASSDTGSWPFSTAMRTETIQIVDDLNQKFPRLPAGPWSDPPQSAALLPVPSNIAHQLAGFLVLGISSRLRFDNSYRAFYELATTQIATAIANARAYEEERKRADALLEIDRAKTVFFSNVSHEFRTPLTLMLGPIEDMIAAAGGNVAVERGDLELVHRNCLRLLKLVNALLDFSRIEAGRMKASFVPTDLAAFTADLASVFQSAIEKAGLRYNVDCTGLNEMVYVDREMWENIVLNLISNAFKFTFAGEITVRLRKVGALAELSVLDSGTGIHDEELQNIFQRFHRVEGAQGRTHEGSGIGLAMIQELAKLHGGTVRAESTHGRGSRFTVSIPVRHEPATSAGFGTAAPHATITQGAQAFAEEAFRWLPEPMIAEADELRAEPVTQLPVKGDAEKGESVAHRATRILVADDNADLRRYVQRLLMDAYNVDAVADGAAALAAIRENPPDLVVSDIMMPNMDGFALLKALRSDASTRSIPIVLLSARAGEESQVEGLEAGADDYLVKPFSANQLRARIRNLVAMKRTRDLLQSELATQSEDIAALTEDLVASRQELQRANSAARVSEERWRAVFENSAAGIAVTDADGRFQAVNTAFQKMLGYSEDELRSMSFVDVTHEDDRQTHTSDYKDLLEGRCENVRAETRYRNRLGAVIWANVHIALMADLNGNPRLAVAVADDITDRVRAEEKVRESERRFQLLLESIPHHVWSLRIDGTMGYWNQKLLDYTGMTREQIATGGWEAVHPDDIDRVREAWRQARLERRPYELEQRIRSSDGRYRRFLCRAGPVPNAVGEFTEWYGTDTDIEERKRAEEALQDARTSLARVARVTMMGELSASIAHEVNQPLTAIAASADACARWLNRPEPDLQEARLAAMRIGNQANRMSQVIAKMTALLKNTPPETSELDMNSLITDVLVLTHHEIAQNEVTLSTDLLPELYRTRGDAVQLQQVIVNLIMNAIEATTPTSEQNRKLVISSTNRGPDEILILVRDTGVGLDPTRADEIFKPFVTSKKGGMGMGLAISKSIIKAHGGRLWAVANEDQGTTFQFSLPVSGTALEPATLPMV